MAIGTIGKQRPKMNYSVSSPSLTNKLNERAAHVTLCRHNCIAKHLLIVTVFVRGSAILSWPSLRSACCAAPYRFSSLCWAIISIFFHFIQFLEAAAGGEVDRTLIFISFFLPTQQSTLWASICACLPSSSTATLLPWRPTRVGWTHRKTKS